MDYNLGDVYEFLDEDGQQVNLDGFIFFKGEDKYNRSNNYYFLRKGVISYMKKGGKLHALTGVPVRLNMIIRDEDARNKYQIEVISQQNREKANKKVEVEQKINKKRRRSQLYDETEDVDEINREKKLIKTKKMSDNDEMEDEYYQSGDTEDMNHESSVVEESDESSTVKRKAGRPKGSKNKPKPGGKAPMNLAKPAKPGKLGGQPIEKKPGRPKGSKNKPKEKKPAKSENSDDEYVDAQEYDELELSAIKRLKNPKKLERKTKNGGIIPRERAWIISKDTTGGSDLITIMSNRKVGKNNKPVTMSRGGRTAYNVLSKYITIEESHSMLSLLSDICAYENRTKLPRAYIEFYAEEVFGLYARTTEESGTVYFDSYDYAAPDIENRYGRDIYTNRKTKKGEDIYRVVPLPVKMKRKSKNTNKPHEEFNKHYSLYEKATTTVTQNIHIDAMKKLFNDYKVYIKNLEKLKKEGTVKYGPHNIDDVIDKARQRLTLFSD